MRNIRMLFALLMLCLGVLWGGVEQTLAQSNLVQPSTWGGIKAVYGISDKADAQRIGGIGRYDPFPIGWKFPFHGTSKITVGYNGYGCGSSDSYHCSTCKDQYAIDWSSKGGDLDRGEPVLAPASGWATPYYCSDCTKGYGNYVVVEAGNGYSYLVAHLDRIDLGYQCVWVERGRQLGTLGCTGYCWGAHIHFAVYKSGWSVKQNGISGINDLQICGTYSSGQ